MTNKLFPGRPDYTGPTKGWFGLLHHDELVEHSWDVTERVRYVRNIKPTKEVGIRLHNMIYLGGCKTVVKRDALANDTAAKLSTINAGWNVNRRALSTEHTKEAGLLYSLDTDHTIKLNAIDTDYAAKCDALAVTYSVKRIANYADFTTKRNVLDVEILAYIKTYIPD